MASPSSVHTLTRPSRQLQMYTVLFTVCLVRESAMTASDVSSARSPCLVFLHSHHFLASIPSGALVSILPLPTSLQLVLKLVPPLSW